MKNTWLVAAKTAALIAALLFVSACVYDGKVTDPNTGLEHRAAEILYNYESWLEEQQAEYNEIERARASLASQQEEILEQVEIRAEQTEKAVGMSVAELETRNQIGRSLVSLGADYAVQAIPGAGPLIDAVLPYLFATGAGAAAGAGGPAAVRKLRKRKNTS